jgi:hypothetical protein
MFPSLNGIEIRIECGFAKHSQTKLVRDIDAFHQSVLVLLKFNTIFEGEIDEEVCISIHHKKDI